MTVTRDTWLTINGIDLATYAWEVTDLSELLDTEPNLGENEKMPDAYGRRPFARLPDERQVTLPMIIYGGSDEDGNPTSDPVLGVIHHRDYLRENLGVFEQSNGGLVPMVWHLPASGGELEVDVQVLGLFGWRDTGAPGVMRTTLDIVIPAGDFAEVAS